MEYLDICILEPSHSMIVSACPQNMPVIILFRLNMDTLEFEDHELIYDANVRGVIGKLYVSTQDRTKFYLDLEKAVLKITDKLATETRHSQYVMTGSQPVYRRDQTVHS